MKSHNIISIIIGILFLVLLQFFSTPYPIFRFLVPAFLIYVIAVSLYNRWYLRQIQKYNFWVVLRPLLLLLAGFGLFLLIPSAGLRSLFLIISVCLIFFVEFALGNFAENILINETLIIAFGFFITLTALNQYFPSLSFICLIGTFVLAALLARSFYEFIPQTPKTKIVASVVLGFFASQLFWALNFLPLHFSALAVILFNLYYFCLILNYYHFFQTLSLKKLQFHLALILVCSGAVLVATPWKILR